MRRGPIVGTPAVCRAVDGPVHEKPPVSAPHVQLIVDIEHSDVPPSLQAALNRLQARVSIRSLAKALTNGVSPSADVCVILSDRNESDGVLDRILVDASDRACATLVLPREGRPVRMPNSDPTSSHLPAARMAVDQMPAQASVDELTGRIKALCEIRAPLRRMQQELAQLRRRDAELTAGARHFDEQIEMASQLQADLMPALPDDTGPLSISMLYLPADRVSGDLYDISWIDEDRLGVSIADATGHGMPAALLTIFVKNVLRAREVVARQDKLIEPDELLARLNRELIRSNLSQCQFVTGLHAIFDQTTCRIRWARGGVPYPILLRAGRRPERLVSQGGLIGAFEDQAFEKVEHQFEHGDVLLFHTDGLEALFRRRGNGDRAFNLLETEWMRRLTLDGPEVALAEARQLALSLPDTQWYKDDITAIALSLI